MTDEIITELWAVKDDIAREHGYDLDALAVHFQATQRTENQRVVDLQAIKKTAEPSPSSRAHSARR